MLAFLAKHLPFAAEGMQMVQDPVVSLGFAARRRGASWTAPFTALAGMIATVVALAVGAVLAVFTALAVAVFALCASILVFFAGFALRARRQSGGRNRRADDPAEGVIEARKVGDTWETYGWERTGR